MVDYGRLSVMSYEAMLASKTKFFLTITKHYYLPGKVNLSEWKKIQVSKKIGNAVEVIKHIHEVLASPKYSFF